MHWLYQWHVGLLHTCRACASDRSLCWCHHPGTQPDMAHTGQDPGSQGQRLVAPAGVVVAIVSGCSNSAKTRVHRGFARSCFSLRNPSGEENTPK